MYTANIKHYVKYITLSLTIFVLFTQLQPQLYAKDNTIKICAPDKLSQGTENAVISLATEEPLPQKTLDEFLYSTIYFSNPGIHVKDISFKNQYVITCVIDIDRTAPIDEEHNPVDIHIVSYDEDGVPYYFSGEDMFTIKRKPFVEEIIIGNDKGVIVKGEPVKLTLKGKNFVKGDVKGDVGVVFEWSGIGMMQADYVNETEITLNIKAETTKYVKSGEYKVRIFNSGITNSADVTVMITDH